MDISKLNDDQIDALHHVEMDKAYRRLRREALRDVIAEIEAIVRLRVPRAAVIIIDPDNTTCQCIGRHRRHVCHCD